jgi:hypothetical protein
MIGARAVCSKGVVGIITGFKNGIWIGYRVDNGKPWQSKHPILLSETSPTDEELELYDKYSEVKQDVRSMG